MLMVLFLFINECKVFEQDRSALKQDADRLNLGMERHPPGIYSQRYLLPEESSEEMSSLMKRSIHILHTDARKNIEIYI